MTVTKLECWQKPQQLPPLPSQPQPMARLTPPLPPLGNEPTLPLPTLGTQEGTASLLIGINGNENYKADPLHLWCSGRVGHLPGAEATPQSQA